MRVFLALVFLLFSSASASGAEDSIVFDFEEGLGEWNVPGWTIDDNFYFAGDLAVSDDHAKSGERSLAVHCEFPGDTWKAVLVEHFVYDNLAGRQQISAWLYLPKDAKGDFYQARIVLMVGPWWVETKHSVKLRRGEWTELVADLDLDFGEQFTMWDCRDEEKCIAGNLDMIRSIAVRIEYNASAWHAGPAYSGPVYIDEVTVK